MQKEEAKKINNYESIVLTTLLLAGLTDFSQTIKLKDSTGQSSSHPGCVRAPSSDSFDFCGLRFPTFRDCVEAVGGIVVRITLTPLYVSCTDVGALSWDYMRSIDIAEMNIKNHLSDLEKEGKITSKEIIYCNVLGNRIKAYYVKRTATDGLIWSDLRMGAVVNDRAIILRLIVFKPVVTNQQIPPVFRQIITLAE